MSKAPAARFPSANELSNALDEALNNRPTSSVTNGFAHAVLTRGVGSVVVAACILVSGGYFGSSLLSDRSKSNKPVAELPSVLPKEQLRQPSEESLNSEALIRKDKEELQSVQFGFALPLESVTGLANHSFEEQERRTLELIRKGDPVAKIKLARVYIYCRGDLVYSLKKLREQNQQAAPKHSTTAFDPSSDAARSERVITRMLGQSCSEEKVRQSFQWLGEIANSGNTRIAVQLAEMLIRGSGGLVANPAKAVEWAEKAAKSGDPEGLFTRGVLFYKGRGILKNKETAFDYFEQAAMNGSMEGQFWMSRIFADGWSSKHPQDQRQAYVWAIVATANQPERPAGKDDPIELKKQTLEEASKLRAELETMLPEAAQRDAQEMAKPLGAEIKMRSDKFWTKLKASFPYVSR